jgi:hypothetical protein
MIFEIMIKAKMIITVPMIMKSIRPKPLEPNFSDFNNFCIIVVKLHHIFIWPLRPDKTTLFCYIFLDFFHNFVNGMLRFNKIIYRAQTESFLDIFVAGQI